MACCEQNQCMTAEDYIKGLLPGVTVGESVLANVLIAVGLSPDMSVWDLGERERDLAYAYLILYSIPGMGSSQRVSDRDGDWEHSESTASWSYTDRASLLRVARALLAKWGIEDPLAETSVPQWKFRGTGFRKIRRNR